MTSAGNREDAWTERLQQRLPLPAGQGIGIGDDAALLRVGAGDVVAAKDVIVDGRHFDVAACGVPAAVYKAVAINLSDLAAVAALPDGFLLGAVLPAARAQRWSEDLLQGIEAAVLAFGIPCIGGDTNVADGPLVLSVTVLGHPGPHGFVQRKGARVGDVLSVTGALGGSRAGRHLHPVPRLDEAQALAGAGLAHALIDISDGLSSDLRRMCMASGVGATVLGAQVPVHRDVGADNARVRLDHALHDGEDFELLVAHPEPDDAQRRALRASGVVLHPLGVCVPLADGIGLTWEGVREPLRSGGYDHFASS